MLVLSRTSVDTEAWSRRYHFQVSQTCLPGAFCCWFGLRGSLWLPLSLPLASDQFFTLNSLLRTRIRSQAAMWVSYRPDQAWVALLLNIASSISCHKLAGVALARCLSRQVKNDPPTADRTAQLAGWAMGVLGRPIPRAPGAGGRYRPRMGCCISLPAQRRGLGPQRGGSNDRCGCGRGDLGSGSSGKGGRQESTRTARLLVYAGGRCELRALGGGTALATGGLAAGGSRGG